jgi:uncharacterized protein (DUF934 family)
MSNQEFIHYGQLKPNVWRLFESNSGNGFSLPPDEPYWMVEINHLMPLIGQGPRQHKVGLILKTESTIKDLIVDEVALHELGLIAFLAIDFPAYSDGRGFSLAWSLRNEYQWAGELRALGDVLIDTVNYLSRCGFDSFVLKEGHSPSDAIDALDLFTQPYQTHSISSQT